MKIVRTMKTALLAMMAGAFVLFPAAPLAAEESPAARPHPHGSLVIVLTTGLEDMQAVNSSLRHARIIKESGYLENVVWLAYGRGVQALAGGMKARPAETAELARQTQAAGIPLIACRTALAGMGIPEESLDPKPAQVVPQGVVKLAELVSLGYEIIRY